MCFSRPMEPEDPCEKDAGVVATALTYCSRGRSPASLTWVKLEPFRSSTSTRRQSVWGVSRHRAGSVGEVGAVQRNGQPGSEADDETPIGREEAAEQPAAGLDRATGGVDAVREALHPAEPGAERSAGEPGTGRTGPDAAPAAPGCVSALFPADHAGDRSGDLETYDGV